MSEVDKVISYISKELGRDLTLEDLLIIGITYYFAFEKGKNSVGDKRVDDNKEFKDDLKLEV